MGMRISIEALNNSDNCHETMKYWREKRRKKKTYMACQFQIKQPLDNVISPMNTKHNIFRKGVSGISLPNNSLTRTHAHTRSV